MLSQASTTWSNKHDHFAQDAVKYDIQIKANFQIICKEFFYDYEFTHKQFLEGVKYNTKSYN